MNSLIPPIIFIGMHRSGTSLLGRLLDDLGLFSGTRKDVNNESLFFQKLNEWLLNQAGGRWDHPDPIRHLLNEPDTSDLIDDYLKTMLSSPRLIEFLGISRYWHHRRIVDGLPYPWGWKDPRNTFTLPIWLRLFPEAKVIYIERHGVDVADSLSTRRSKSVTQLADRYYKLRPLYWLYEKRTGFSDSSRCMTLEGAFSLWEEYVQMGRRLVSDLAPENVLILKYEDLLQNPKATLDLAGNFCHLTFSDSDVARAVSQIEPSRSYAFQKQPKLVDFAQGVENRLLGYDAQY